MNRRILAILAILLLLAVPLAACRGGSSVVGASDGSLEGTKKVDRLDASLQAGADAFAFGLYDRLAKENDGFFLSPASIYLALMMTRSGAAGATAEEMDAVFGTSGKTLDQADAFARDLQYLVTGRTPAAFELANSLWIRHTFEEFVSKDFLQRNNTYFGAAIHTIDFDAAGAPKTINDWVAANTKQRIKTVIDGAIDPATVMYLINTIYFKSDWRTPFDALETRPGTFHAPGGDVEARMMSRIDDFGYFADDRLQAVRLPYADGRTSMWVVLPKVGQEDAIATLDAATWKTLRDGVSGANTHMLLRMPRTKFEFKSYLKGTLSDMGMPTAFTDGADFTGIAAQGNLMIGDVLHKTFLLIDEKGTEAAAATSVEIRTTSMPVEPDVQMIVDRPFLVAIVDDGTGLPIFLGRIATP